MLLCWWRRPLLGADPRARPTVGAAMSISIGGRFKGVWHHVLFGVLLAAVLAPTVLKDVFQDHVVLLVMHIALQVKPRETKPRGFTCNAICTKQCHASTALLFLTESAWNPQACCGIMPARLGPSTPPVPTFHTIALRDKEMPVYSLCSALYSAYSLYYAKCRFLIMWCFEVADS